MTDDTSGLFHDRIHKDVGRGRAAKSVKVRSDFRRRRDAALKLLETRDTLMSLWDCDLPGRRLLEAVLRVAHDLLGLGFDEYLDIDERRRIAESLLLDAAAIDWENEEP